VRQRFARFAVRTSGRRLVPPLHAVTVGGTEESWREPPSTPVASGPAGKDSNWVPTSADGQFEVLFRLYGPEKPLFDKTWKLPDIEKVS
jgi:hypothetical protein